MPCSRDSELEQSCGWGQTGEASCVTSVAVCYRGDMEDEASVKENAAMRRFFCGGGRHQKRSNVEIRAAAGRYGILVRKLHVESNRVRASNGSGHSSNTALQLSRADGGWLRGGTPGSIEMVDRPATARWS